MYLVNCLTDWLSDINDWIDWTELYKKFKTIGQKPIFTNENYRWWVGKSMVILEGIPKRDTAQNKERRRRRRRRVSGWRRVVGLGRWMMLGWIEFFDRSRLGSLLCLFGLVGDFGLLGADGCWGDFGSLVVMGWMDEVGFDRMTAWDGNDDDTCCCLLDGATF